jgi:hypothetical protein
MEILWVIYSGIVAASFAAFARKWFRTPHRWHIGLMSLSYSLLVLIIAFDGQLMVAQFIEPLAILIGMAGLGYYWSGTLGDDDDRKRTDDSA